ncbi:Uncharacterised protein [Candidatus Venteria ishoeyi]|uniref:Uncharacterized protein n=1 Tax=Candidatus Venteria ishoeyi TaxID=1899563 RepID=A0A1H6F9S3_9GAMM|nr:Uncharacterised protein [Candidatus Venteria ishoeyi]
MKISVIGLGLVFLFFFLELIYHQMILPIMSNLVKKLGSLIILLQMSPLTKK